MAPPIKQCSFSGGEITPALYARTDHALYDKSLRTLRNMFSMRHGGVTGRPGTLYVGTTLNGGNQVRLIPFIFNETGLGQSYVLEFGNQYIAFYQNGGVVVSSTKTISGATQANPCVITATSHGFSNGDIVTIGGVSGMTQLNNATFIIANVTTNTFSLKDLLGNAIDSTAYGAYVSGGSASKIYTIATTYLQADLQNLQFAESADVVTITHPSYAPMELKRLGATNWTLTGLSFFSGNANNFVITASMGGTAGTPVPWNNYFVGAVNSNGEEGSVSFLQIAPASAAAFAVASNATPVNLVWTAPVNGASYYKIYRFTQVGVGAPPYANGPFGYIGQTTNLRFTDNGITPDFTNAPPISPTLFGSTNNYPSTVGFVQQRRGFANTNTNPIGFWLSQPGDFSNFDIHVTPQDSDGIIATLAGEEVNAIQHILELKFMLMLTAGAEIYVQGNGSGVVTPSGINASTQSQYGCAPLRPLKVGDVILFNQALGSAIRDFSFDFSIDGYRGNDITVFATHLFEGYTLSDWAYQKLPDSIAWAVRSDGVLLSCTYVREQQILAWARHDFTNGTVENICSIPENGEYGVYLSIKRTINGQTVRYIERMSSRIWQGAAAEVAVGTANSNGDPIDATYLDCFVSFDGRNAGSTTMTLTASGAFQTGTTAYQQQLTLTASAGFFTSSMIGDQIFLQDAEWIATQGAEGNQIRCTIQAYTSSTIVTVTPSGVVPAEFQALPITIWARAVPTVSGLGYLKGQQVSVWADRYVVGSPLNYHLSTVYTVSSSGSITLDKPYSVIYVGLPIIQDFETLDLETSFGETILAKRKRQAKLAIYLLNSRTLFAGSENPDKNLDNVNDQALFQLYELKKGTSMVQYDQPPDLATDQDYIIEDTRYNKNGRIFIRNVDPTPLSILAVSPQGDSAAPSPFYEKV